MKTIITILDGITETSMPYNEFVVYRANHFKDEHQVLIICGQENKKMKVPSNIEVFYVGRNIFKIRKVLSAIIKKYKKEYVIHIHQVQSGFLAQVSMLGTKFRKKVIFTVHSTFSGYSIHNKILSFINSFLAYKTTCVSNTSYNNYPSIIKFIKKDRIQPIQNGVDTERIDNSFLLNYKKDHDNNLVKFVYVARIIPIKNHKFLIDVLQETKKNIRFIFIGEDISNLKDYCDKNDLSNRIEFTGLIPREEVFEKIQQADVYISSSTLEGLPISVLEAMYCGLPVILSDIPQHKEIKNDKDFINVIPLNIDKWKNIINDYADMNCDEIEKIGNKCKEYVKEYFSLKNMHYKYDKIYSSMF